MSSDETVERIRNGEGEVSTLVEFLDAEDQKRRKAASVALSRIADDSPERLEGFEGTLVPFLSSDHLSVRMHVSSALVPLSRRDPELGIDALPALQSRLDDKSLVVQRNVLSVLRIVAEADPSTVEPATGPIVDLLDSEMTAIRRGSVAILLRVAQESPTSLRSHVEKLVARLEERADSAPSDGRSDQSTGRRVPRRERDSIERARRDERLRVEAIRDDVALILATIAEADSTAFEGHSDAVLAHADDERMIVRKSVAEIGGLAGAGGVFDPEPTAEKLIDRLAEDRFDIVRGRAAWALGHLSEQSEQVRSAAATALLENLDLFGSDDVEVRIGAATLLSTVASCLEGGEEVRSEIVALLEDESPIVRRHAVYALGTLDDDRFSDHLERVRDEDSDSDVVDLAAGFLVDDT